MTGMIEWLEEQALEDRKVVATLRKSLAFAPGSFPKAFPYVEPFLSRGVSDKQREVYYLVACLWASHWKVGLSEKKMNIAEACKDYMSKTESVNFEKRFILVLDADSSELPYHLRQLIALLKDYPIDFSLLLKDLVFWDKELKESQNAWARTFYRQAES